MSPPRSNNWAALIVVAVLLWLAIGARAAVTDADVYNHLAQFEGWRDAPYQLRGVWHVGLGHNLTAHGQKVRFYSRIELESFARADIAAARQTCRTFVWCFDELPDTVQIVTMGLAFNVGRAGFAQFTGLRLALKWRAWNLAYTELGLSKWAQQVSPIRASYYLRTLRNAHDR